MMTWDTRFAPNTDRVLRVERNEDGYTVTFEDENCGTWTANYDKDGGLFDSIWTQAVSAEYRQVEPAVLSVFVVMDMTPEEVHAAYLRYFGK